MPSEPLQAVTAVAMLVFVVGSMAAMGLGLTVARIVEPLRDLRLVTALLIVNFVVVPAAAVAATRLLPMTPAAASAVALLGCVAGAPFLPKLAQLARGDVAIAVGSMVLLMVATIGYAPLVIPLVVAGATVDPLQIAGSLVVFMLVPLGLGLLIRSRRPRLADSWMGRVGRASTIGLLLGIAGGLLLTWRDVIGAIGSRVFVGVAIVLVVGLASGWVAGIGRPSRDRIVAGLATSQRNIAAALVVAGTIGGETLVYTLVGALVLPVALIALATVLGRRTAPSSGADG